MALILGMLKNAQFENIVGTPTSLPTGRFWADVTAPAAALPKFFDGTTTRTLLFANPSAFISQSSGKDVTVNWATGVNQKVILTDNCVIRFSNPQEGYIHTLEVVQRSTTTNTPFIFTFDMVDQENSVYTYQPGIIPFGMTKSFQWYYNSGAIATSTNGNSNQFAPVTIPATAVTGLAFSKDGKAVTIGSSGTPFSTTYQVDPFTPPRNNSNLGARNIATPVAAAATVLDVAYHPSNNFIFLVGGTTPFIQGFTTDRYTAFGTAMANPGTLPTGSARCVDVSPTGNAVAVGHATSPFMSIYPFSGSGFGTKVTDPVSLPAAQVNGIAFSPQNDYLAVASQTSPFLEVYAYSEVGSTYTIGNKSANPSSLPAAGPAGGTGKVLAWRPQGDYIAMGVNGGNFIYVVPFNRTTGTFGTPLTVTSTPTGIVTSLAWSKCGSYLFCGSASALYLTCYDFGSFLLNTTVSVGNFVVLLAINAMDVSPMNNSLVIGGAAANLSSIPVPLRAKNYLRIL